MRIQSNILKLFILLSFIVVFPVLAVAAKPKPLTEPKEIVQYGNNLTIEELDKGIYRVVHAWPWPSNSLAVWMEDSTLLLIDTPYTPEATEKLLMWAKTRFHPARYCAIVTHYHIDRMGGISALLERGIPVYGSNETAQLVVDKGDSTLREMANWVKQAEIRETYRHLNMVPPDHLFPQTLGLSLGFGKETVEVFYPGPAHTPDNLVAWFPQRKLLFGGCLIISGDKMGNMAEANLPAWENSIQVLMKKYKPQLVIPGHGGENFHFSAGLLPNTLKVVKETVKQQAEKEAAEKQEESSDTTGQNTDKN